MKTTLWRKQKMRTKKNLLVACFVGLTLTFGIAGASLAGVIGSVHDMTQIATQQTMTGVDPLTGLPIFGANPVDGAERGACSYCHTPHHALNSASTPYQPLWSRPETTETFTQYHSSSLHAADDNLDAAGGNDLFASDFLIGPSRLCMSCHDGVTALDSNYGNTGDAYSISDGDSWNGIEISQGSSLSNDHPVGFQYEPVATADDEINTAVGLNFIGNASVSVASVLYTDPAATTEQPYMTCSTCHDVHDTKTVDDYLLYSPRAGSQLCLTCHAK
jgi:predicted CXXCH cytochrome family protein